jgi:antitoxin YefM
MYGYTVRLNNGAIVDSVSVNKFRDNLKTFVEQIVTKHVPLKVTRRSGEDFIVIGADDWEREQETLYVLQNKNLMKQVAASLNSHNKGVGYRPTQDELNEITGI